MSSNRDFASAREIIQKSLTLDSGKVVVFIQTFGPQHAKIPIRKHF